MMYRTMLTAVMAVMLMAVNVNAEELVRRPFSDDSVHVMVSENTVEFRFAPGYAGLYSSDSASLLAVCEAANPEFGNMIRKAVESDCHFLDGLVRADAIFWVDLLSEVSDLDKLVVQAAMNGGAGMARGSYGANASLLNGMEDPGNNINILYLESTGEGYDHRIARFTLNRHEECNVTDSLGVIIDSLGDRVTQLEQKPDPKPCTTSVVTEVETETIIHKFDWTIAIGQSFGTNGNMQKLRVSCSYNQTIGVDVWGGMDFLSRDKQTYWIDRRGELSEITSSMYTQGIGVNLTLNLESIAMRLNGGKSFHSNVWLFIGRSQIEWVASELQEHDIKDACWVIGLRINPKKGFLRYFTFEVEYDGGYRKHFDDALAKSLNAIRAGVYYQHNF